MSEPAVKSSQAPDVDFTTLFDDLGAEFLSGKTRDLAWRRAQLKAVQRMMQDSEAELFAALKADLGKSAQESFTTETSFVSAEAAYAARKLNRWTRNRRVSTPLIAQPGRSWVQPEPLGTVLIIGAWNYPLQLTLAGMTAAIAAGNCVVIKPSELAPATSTLLARLVPEYLDGDCIRVVEGAVPETTREPEGILPRNIPLPQYFPGRRLTAPCHDVSPKFGVPADLLHRAEKDLFAGYDRSVLPRLRQSDLPGDIFLTRHTPSHRSRLRAPRPLIRP